MKRLLIELHYTAVPLVDVLNRFQLLPSLPLMGWASERGLDLHQDAAGKWLESNVGAGPVESFIKVPEKAFE